MDIKQILSEAAAQGASDIHLVFGSSPMVRHDGELTPFKSVGGEILPTMDDGSLVAAVQALISREKYQELVSGRDLDSAAESGSYRFRCNFSYDRGHLKLVARVIDSRKPSLDDLGLPDTVTKLLDLQQGLILVTGPTGCGKSTTLAAMINHINQQRNCHIITLEDPIEYIFSSEKSIISQRQLGEDMTSFAAGLRHALRQDPNVVMVGEMRDLESVATAITLAETGHLVLATLHTYSAAQTIDRIIDLFPGVQQNQVRSQLSMILAAVISQRLLPKIGGGRIAAREILLKNGATSNLIRENKIAQIKTVLETNFQNGMITMDRSLKDLYRQGLISRDSALDYLEEPGLLDS